jgi:hypothetical protein
MLEMSSQSVVSLEAEKGANESASVSPTDNGEFLNDQAIDKIVDDAVKDVTTHALGMANCRCEFAMLLLLTPSVLLSLYPS